MRDVAAMILAGGLSTRFGSDKAVAEYGGETMVQRVYRAVTEVTTDIYLSLRPGQDRYSAIDAEPVYDKHPGGGPMVGIQAGLEVTAANWLLVVACDMPNVRGTDLRRLLTSRRAGVDAVIATEAGGQLHPTCACYHKRCLPLFQTCIDRGARSLFAAIQDMPHVRVELAGHVLTNVNEQTDLPDFSE